MAEKTYVVTAACAVVYNADRTAAVTVARGGKVPPGSDPEHVKLLLDRGLIAEGEASGGLDVDPDAAPPFPAPAAGQSSRSSSYDGTSAPAKSGSKADWVDWAVKVEGVAPDSDEAKALGEKTRDELADTYADRTPATPATS